MGFDRKEDLKSKIVSKYGKELRVCMQVHTKSKRARHVLCSRPRASDKSLQVRGRGKEEKE